MLIVCNHYSRIGRGESYLCVGAAEGTDGETLRIEDGLCNPLIVLCSPHPPVPRLVLEIHEKLPTYGLSSFVSYLIEAVVPPSTMDS